MEQLLSLDLQAKMIVFHVRQDLLFSEHRLNVKNVLEVLMKFADNSARDALRELILLLGPQAKLIVSHVLQVLFHNLLHVPSVPQGNM